LGLNKKEVVNKKIGLVFNILRSKLSENYIINFVYSEMAFKVSA